MKPRLPQRFGPYTLTELIARGGMAEIYRATMPGVGGFEKTVAIKKILPHLAENDEFITMLIDEARIIVSINHANIAQVYDLGKIEDDYYIAMEYIHGIDLSTIVKELKERHETVPMEHAVFIGSCICAGLHVAHNKHDSTGRPQNIVHRDVSPHNILISFAGDVKIIDFGVAKARGKDANTKLGVIKGKLLYMAPEQAMAKPIDGRADLFAAGLILYRMLTNRLPFEGENEFQIYNNILSKEIAPPRDINPAISEEVNQIVMMLLQRDPSKRYQDGYSAKVDLDRALQSLAPGYSVSRLSRWVEEHFSHLIQRRQERRMSASGANGAVDRAPPTPPHSARDTGSMRGPASGQPPRANLGQSGMQEPVRRPESVGARETGGEGFAPTAALSAAGASSGSRSFDASIGADEGRQTPYQDAPTVQGPTLSQIREAFAGYPSAAPGQAPFQPSVLPTAGDQGQRARQPGKDTTGGFEAVGAPVDAQGAKSVPIAPLVGILLLLLVIAGMLGFQVMSPAPPTDPVPEIVPAQQPEPVEPAPVVAEESAAAVEEQEPAVAEMVKVSVTSTPAGANLFIGDQTLGVTPLEKEIAKSEQDVVLRFELEGYETVEVPVTPLVDISKSVELVAVVAAPIVEEKEPVVEKPAPRKETQAPKKRRNKPKQTKKEEKGEPAIPLLGFDEPAEPKKQKQKPADEDDVLNPFDL